MKGYGMAKVRSQSKAHIDKKAKLATARAMERVVEFANTGDEDAFVKQIKEVFPGISGTELLEKIALFRELKRIRSAS
jgi:hypothetical protein